jgi:hypothetical protein
MQNFGVYDLRIVNPGRFVLEGGEAEADASDAADAGDGGNGDAPFKADGAGSRGGVNSGARLGPDGLGTDLPPALQPTRTDGDDENAAVRGRALHVELC